MSAFGDLDGALRDLTEKARAFGAEREARFQEVLDLLHDLYGWNPPDES